MPSSVDRQDRRTHVLAVRVPSQIYEAVRRLARTPAQRAAWLRDAITQALRRPAPPQPPPSGAKEKENVHGVKHNSLASAKRRMQEQAYRELPKKKADAQDVLLKKLRRIRRSSDSAA
jgi:hypothetical protein